MLEALPFVLLTVSEELKGIHLGSVVTVTPIGRKWDPWREPSRLGAFVSSDGTHMNLEDASESHSFGCFMRPRFG